MKIKNIIYNVNVKKYIFIIILSTIALASVNWVSAQTAVPNVACSDKKNGDACEYTDSFNGTPTDKRTGFCDRTNDDSDAQKNPLKCKVSSDKNGWEDCVVVGDACKSGSELGVCKGKGSDACDTTKKPPGNPGKPSSPEVSNSVTTTSCVTNAEKDNKCGTGNKCTGNQVCANVDGITKCVTNAEKDNKCGTGNKCTGNQVCVTKLTNTDSANTGGASNGSSTSSATTTAGTVSYESYTNFPGVGRISNLCQLITALWLLGFAVLLTSVLGMFLWAGYIYVTAGVNAGKVNQAKEIFTNTITGLIIGLSIYIIINVINPGLLQGNCSIPSVGSGSTIGGPAGPSNIVPKPGESVFPVTGVYQCPGPRTSFGYARGRLHAGVDLTPPLSTVSDAQALQLPILAFRDGTVTEVGGGFGVVGIDHGGGLETRYLHNSKIFVSRGQKVNAGQEIAKMGDAGSPGVIHAHFEVYQNGRPVDPAPVIFDSGKNPDPSKVKTTGNPRCVGQNS
jgi:hypothetical protein